MRDIGVPITDNFKLLLPPGDIVIQNDTVHDYSQSHNHGTVSGATQALTPWGRGLSFDGVDDAVDFGDVFDVGTSDFSVGVWFLTKRLDDEDWTGLLTKNPHAGDNGRWGLHLDEPSGTIRALYRPSGGGSETVEGGSVSLYQWNFAVATWDRDGDLTLWLNGNSIGTADISADDGYDIQLSQELLLGASNNTSSFNLHGEAAKAFCILRLLTAAEIQNIYRATKPRTSRVMHCSPVAADVEDTDCKLAIDFNGDVDDRSPAGVSTGPAGMTYEAGVQGQAGHFDGTNDSLDVTGVTATNNFLAMCWIRSSTTGDSEYVFEAASGQFVFGKGVEATNANWGAYDGSWYYADSDPFDGEWHHLAVFQDGTSLAFYLDGVADGTDTSAGNTIGGDAAIGSNDTEDGNYFPGDIDRFRIYDAITQAKAESIIAAEVEANYPR